jgi:regulator of protease activity HflC (stomatin/prohibitin superfamily)
MFQISKKTILGTVLAVLAVVLLIFSSMLILGTVLAVLAVVLLIFSSMLIEDVGGNDIVFVKAIGTGKLKFVTTPGWTWRGGGEVTHIPKSFQYWFSKKGDQGNKFDQSIKARFNDNGHGSISGSVRIDTPLDALHLRSIYSRYGSYENLQNELIRTVFENAIYMTGPLMSSTESASSKRTLLRTYIEDQAQAGIYKTQTRESKVKDAITGAEKTITIVELIQDPLAVGGIARQEDSPLKVMGFKVSNLSINEIEYEKAVNDQIAAQQKLIMDVQISMAQAKQAEQKALTVAKEGEAKAAEAKWKQETIKAQMVTEGEQKRDVAKLERDAAEFNKQKNILEGQGEAERKRLVMEGDGALTQKLQTYEKVMHMAFSEFGKQKWVPEIQMGAGGASGGSAVDLINLLTAKTAKDIGLDMKIKNPQHK